MVNLNDSNVDSTINSDTPVLVDFWASWCTPCLMLAPVLEEIDAERNKGDIMKLNVDDVPAVAAKYMVSSIPTLIVFKNGQEVERIVGVQAKEKITALLDKHQ